MLAWLRELNTTQKKTVAAAFGGWAVDALDFMVYTFVIPTLMAAWMMSKAEAGLIATATLVVSSIGGWLAGILADRFGRVRILQITILWFSVATFLCGFANSFEQLLVLRAIQGLGFGGEWAVGSVLIAEMITAKHRGKAVGCVQSGWAVGWAVAAILFAVCFSVLPENLAWRALFWAGILPALLVLFIRRNVPETEIFQRVQSQRHSSEHISSEHKNSKHKSGFLEIFSPRYLGITLLSSLLVSGLMSAYYAVVTWLPTYLKSVRHLQVLDSGFYTAIIIAGSWCGYVTAAYLTDYIGRRKTFIVFALGTVVIAPGYASLPLSNSTMLFLGFPLGFCLSGNFSGFGSYLAELYPNRIRGSGQGFVYNFARGVASFAPPLVGFLADHPPALFAYLHWLVVEPLALAILTVSLSACAIALSTLIILPETRGRELLSEVSLTRG